MTDSSNAPDGDGSFWNGGERAALSLKQVAVEDAVGQALCHDLTRIVPETMKGAQFRKGHIVREEDIPLLLSMGKTRLYVWERQPGMVHEDEAAARLAALCRSGDMAQSEALEGKIELSARSAGLFRIDLERFYAVNSIPGLIIAARHTLSAVRAGDRLAGMRAIPLMVPEAALAAAEAAAGGKPLFELLPYTLKTAGVLITGSEVASGRISDAFTPILAERLAAYGISLAKRLVSDDGTGNIAAGIAEIRSGKPDLIICTGGMSVDPDDNTPGGIRQSGADIVTHGAPMLPGSMFLLGYYADGTPVVGLPGAMLYKKRRAGILDVLLPRIAAGVRQTRRDFVALSNGGLCLNCPECRYPVCPYGKTG
ncbi:molybdopterin-binding protein [Treponema endosymbiont of Eucomonympha sp.]|uniref:molybdopterin-binding protein n=1 Tax=Treponema endosymbiont of Eucomonympha sp. TaxID=1580831 RepID=UPI000AE2F660|nr:molybdopterin-binding protein [Treponema endosymbiont of Eucomonympha sp.]